MKLFSLQALFKRFCQEPPLGWAQLSHQKVRLLVALTGVAFADILIFTMLGFKEMFFEGSTFTHNHLQADLVLISQRTEALYYGRTFSRRHLYQANAVEGVTSADPLYVSEAGWVNPWDRKITSVIVLAFDPARPILDLPEVNEQLDQIKLPNVFLLDRKSQPKLGPVAKTLGQGETVTTEISGRRIKVGGLFTLGSSIFTDGHMITSDWNYLRLYGKDSLDNVNLGALTLEPNADIETVRQTLQNRLPKDVKVLTPKEFIQTEITFWTKRPAGVIFNFGAIMGAVVGIVIVNQVLYSDVNDHLPEYATLKAMGYSDRRLLSVVFQEAIILALLGFLPGYGISLGMYDLLAFLTKIPLGMRLGVTLQVFIATVTMCMISAAISMRKLNSADPADVF
ncbi:ABC transporter permease DevC [Mastigocoleus sp. MO_188.B34]|uniref:ABC transporter permease DevC n=1 Tax=Mastigocoleus sp. MO_188.B34 TaxID=3036635 RepID=UPI00261CC01F|nr:ABC transporter permease DevC [Mastigocoleus sp. MO_188.B34]MDJ0694030.1 ABC transporter permease DevC [Mastigocoleus sp. MO_188.B34]